MTNQELKLTKVKKSCAVIQKVLLVLRILAAVAAAVCLIVGIACAVMSKEIDSELPKAVEEGKVSVDIDEFEINGIINLEVTMNEALEEGRYAFVFASSCAMGVLACALIFIVLSQFNAIFKTIEQSETPFCEEVSAKLKKIFIGIAIFFLLFESLGCAAIMALTFWVIYNLFDYGTALQIEVDETL